MTNGHTRGPTITYCPAIKVAFRVGFYEGKNCPQSPIPRPHPCPCLFEPVKRRNAWPFLHNKASPNLFLSSTKSCFFLRPYIYIYLYLLALYIGISFRFGLSDIIIYFSFFSNHYIILYIQWFKNKNDRFLFNIETVSITL